MLNHDLSVYRSSRSPPSRFPLLPSVIHTHISLIHHLASLKASHKLSRKGSHSLWNRLRRSGTGQLAGPQLHVTRATRARPRAVTCPRTRCNLPGKKRGNLCHFACRLPPLTRPHLATCPATTLQVARDTLQLIANQGNLPSFIGQVALFHRASCSLS